MKYAVIYESATGNTEMLAKEIKSTLGEEKCVCFGTPEEELQSKAEDADLIFLGFWTDKGECSEKIRKYMETLHNRNVFLFGTGTAYQPICRKEIRCQGRICVRERCLRVCGNAMRQCRRKLLRTRRSR